MTKVLVSKFREFFILAMFVLAAGALSLTASQPAHAAGFVDDVAGKTTIKLKDIPGVGKILSDLKLKKLANTDMAGVTATETTISGFVNFFAMRWNFLVFKGGTETYFALEPVSATGKPRTPKLSDFFKAPGIEVTDMLTFDRMVWVVAARGVELDQGKLPPRSGPQNPRRPAHPPNLPPLRQKRVRSRKNPKARRWPSLTGKSARHSRGHTARKRMRKSVRRSEPLPRKSVSPNVRRAWQSVWQRWAG